MGIENIFDEFTRTEEPAWLKEFRSKSFKVFQDLKAESTELFKHQTFFNDFDLEEFHLGSNKSTLDFDLPDDLKKKGIVVAQINESKDVPHVKQMLASNSKINDKFLQMNNALFNSGLYVYVPKGLQTDMPLRLTTSIKSTTFSKIIFILDHDSVLRVIKEDYSKHSNTPILFSDSVEVLLMDGAELHISHIQNLSQNVIHLTNKTGTCNRNSKIYWNMGYFGGKKVRSSVYSLLLGEGSEAEDIEVLFGNKSQQFDVFSNLVHTGRNTTGRVLSNGVMKDNSNALFKGMIKISEGAKNTNAFLGEHVMLLSREAKAKAIPGLEIETNEVKATHSASVSQIEEEKLFYLMSRGLTGEEAKKMIAFGFFDPVIRKMLLDEMKTKLYHLLELKWQGREEEFLDDLEKLKIDETISAKKKEDMFSGHYKYR